jgi:hypothetical protein
MKTHAQRLNRSSLARAVKEEQRRIRAAALEGLRAQIAQIHTRRRELMDRVKRQCAVGRARAKERIRERREAVKAALALELAEMRQAERNRCALRKARVRHQSETARERAARELRERRRAELVAARIERHRARETKKHTKAEKAKESDDEVRSNIDAEYVPIFDVVKAKVRARPGMSRTEAFLHWLEEHPAEAWQIREELSEKKLRALLREEHEAARALRKVGGRARRRAALEPAPF